MSEPGTQGRRTFWAGLIVEVQEANEGDCGLRTAPPEVYDEDSMSPEDDVVGEDKLDEGSGGETCDRDEEGLLASLTEGVQMKEIGEHQTADGLGSYDADFEWSDLGGERAIDGVTFEEA